MYAAMSNQKLNGGVDALRSRVEDVVFQVQNLVRQNSQLLWLTSMPPANL